MYVIICMCVVLLKSVTQWALSMQYIDISYNRIWVACRWRKALRQKKKNTKLFSKPLCIVGFHLNLGGDLITPYTTGSKRITKIQSLKA